MISRGSKKSRNRFFAVLWGGEMFSPDFYVRMSEDRPRRESESPHLAMMNFAIDTYGTTGRIHLDDVDHNKVST